MGKSEVQALIKQCSSSRCREIHIRIKAESQEGHLSRMYRSVEREIEEAGQYNKHTQI